MKRAKRFVRAVVLPLYLVAGVIYGAVVLGPSLAYWEWLRRLEEADE